MSGAVSRSAGRRVLLLHPGSLYGGDWAGRYNPKPALLGLFSYLRANDADVDVLDLQMELGNPAPDQVEAYLRLAAARLDARTFDVLGISCWTSLEYAASLALARHVREADPEVPIIVGGYHPTAVPEDFMAPGAPFDVVVAGEGEQVLLALARDHHLRAGQAPRLVEGEPLPLDRPHYDFAGYPYTKERPETLGIYLSRGCPHRCAFCMEGSKGRVWRPYSVPVALDLVRAALALRPRVLTFQDACFGHRASWRREFLAGLVAMDVDVPLWAEARADGLGAADLDLMGRLDFYLQLGVETMSPTMVGVMRKAKDGARYVAAVDAALREVSRRGLLTKVFLIVNHPGETADTAEETVAYFERLVEEAGRLSTIVNCQPFAFFAGSDVALRRVFYEHTYGTEIAHPAWWTETGDHHELATRVRASTSFGDPEPVIERIRALHPAIVAKLPAAAKLLYLRHLRKL